MDSVVEQAQLPTFPQRKASLRRWASRETLFSAGAASDGLKSRVKMEASLMSSVGAHWDCALAPLTDS